MITLTHHTARHGRLEHVPEAASHFDGVTYWRDDLRGQWARWTGYGWTYEQPGTMPARIIRERA